MKKQEYIALFESMFPHFFEKDGIRNMPDGVVCEEMVLALDQFDPEKYQKELDDSVTFGIYEGDIEVLKEAVGKVEQNWVDYYNGTGRAYCGYIDGNVVCFCLIDNMGLHNVGDRELKMGGPGCVGTVPEYRNRGVALTMVKHVTQILKDEGYDYSYIHYTGVAPWYAKLGYETVVWWDKHGVLER